MTDRVQTLTLNFRLEAADGDADLERSAAALTESVSALPGVDEADARVADQVRDPLTAMAVLLSVTVAIKQAGGVVQAADGAVQSLDSLVNHIKQLARDLGLPSLWVWLGRKKVKVEELTPEHLEELAAKASDS